MLAANTKRCRVDCPHSPPDSPPAVRICRERVVLTEQEEMMGSYACVQLLEPKRPQESVRDVQAISSTICNPHVPGPPSASSSRSKGRGKEGQMHHTSTNNKRTRAQGTMPSKKRRTCMARPSRKEEELAVIAAIDRHKRSRVQPLDPGLGSDQR